MLYFVKGAFTAFIDILSIPVPLGMGYELQVYHFVVFGVVSAVVVKFLWGLYS